MEDCILFSTTLYDNPLLFMQDLLLSTGKAEKMTGVRVKAPEAHAMPADLRNSHLTRAYIHLDRIAHNMSLLQTLVGKRPLWPVISDQHISTD